MNPEKRLPPAAALRLPTLMQAVGFAIWQLQELENTAASHIVVCLREARGVGKERGSEISAAVERLPLGKLITELSRSGALNDGVASALKTLLQERNWLVHRARRETRGVLSDEAGFTVLIARLDDISERTLLLIRRLGKDLEEYVVRSGVSRDVLDREADRLARSWGFE